MCHAKKSNNKSSKEAKGLKLIKEMCQKKNPKMLIIYKQMC